MSRSPRDESTDEPESGWPGDGRYTGDLSIFAPPGSVPRNGADGARRVDADTDADTEPFDRLASTQPLPEVTWVPIGSQTGDDADEPSPTPGRRPRGLMLGGVAIAGILVAFGGGMAVGAAAGSSDSDARNAGTSASQASSKDSAAGSSAGGSTASATPHASAEPRETSTPDPESSDDQGDGTGAGTGEDGAPGADDDAAPAPPDGGPAHSDDGPSADDGPQAGDTGGPDAGPGSGSGPGSERPAPGTP